MDILSAACSLCATGVGPRRCSVAASGCDLPRPIYVNACLVHLSLSLPLRTQAVSTCGTNHGKGAPVQVGSQLGATEQPITVRSSGVNTTESRHRGLDFAYFQAFNEAPHGLCPCQGDSRHPDEVGEEHHQLRRGIVHGVQDARRAVIDRHRPRLAPRGERAHPDRSASRVVVHRVARQRRSANRCASNSRSGRAGHQPGEGQPVEPTSGLFLSACGHRYA
jgi:hypothetical protein